MEHPANINAHEKSESSFTKLNISNHFCAVVGVCADGNVVYQSPTTQHTGFII